MESERRAIEVHDLSPPKPDLVEEVLRGLSVRPRALPCKLFYDEMGSALFDRICELPEYYPTRTETAILESKGQDIAAAIGPGAIVIEFGSGSSRKTRLLLDVLVEPAGYVPIDISREHLERSAMALAQDYPDLHILPVCADYTRSVSLPPLVDRVARRVVFFPGSTIGNFEPDEVVLFLRRVHRLVGRRGGLLIGVDLKKDKEILEAAYDDAEGVTAAFNRNVLVHLNRELGADFDVGAWDHRAFYDERRGRIEMHLVSSRAQSVTIGGRRIDFEEGETIHTENSYKYSIDEFITLARRAGFRSARVWTDDATLFGVHYFKVGV